jgi:hypothetical protein
LNTSLSASSASALRRLHPFARAFVALASATAMCVAACSLGSSESAYSSSQELTQPATDAVTVSPSSITIREGTTGFVDITVPASLDAGRVYIVEAGDRPSPFTTTQTFSTDANGNTVFHVGIAAPNPVELGAYTLYIGLAHENDAAFWAPTPSFTVNVTGCQGAQACGSFECGFVTDNCGQRVACGVCGDGTTCKGHVCECLGACR